MTLLMNRIPRNCVSAWLTLFFVDGASRMDMLGLTWMALVLTVTVELTWNPSSKTLSLTHILALLTQHPHGNTRAHTLTFHKSCKPSPVINRPSMRQSIRKQCHHEMALHCFCNKIITKIISKEQRDEDDNNHLLYSPAQLHLFCFLSHVCLLINKISWFETEKKKAFGFYFDESECHWCWLKCEKWNWLGCATISTTPVCSVSWDAPD